MIDLTSEPLINLKKACELIPPGRNNKPYHTSTLVREIKKGNLEALWLGGRWVTSLAALQRWAERRTAEVMREAVGPRTSLQSRRAAEAACAKLEKLGYG